MENDYTYIGFICIDEHNKPVLVTKTGNKYNVSGVVGSTLEDNIKIDEYSALIGIIKYFDGTESVTLEYAHKANYEDIIFVIETEGVLSNDGDLTNNQGLNDYWIASLDNNGALLWQNAIGGSEEDLAYSAVSIGTNIIVAGTSRSTNGDVGSNLGSNDYWIVKLDQNGNL